RKQKWQVKTFLKFTCRIQDYYKFLGGKFSFQYNKDFKKNGINNMFKFGDGFIVSSIYRNNMSLKIGKIQKMEVYDKNLKLKRNFGNRKARFYDYFVRNVEDIIDIDGDGKDEIILKAVGSDDVYGQGYIIEVYK
ncbi:MAG TPA: hypothetical protein P5140_08300, partial [Methanofastidiosum sp.]|nr:hypothetical protein [Methanofastidiosum sp.]